LNYFAHAWPLLLAAETRHPDELPPLLAGVAVPDWLAVVARRTRCRARHAAPYVGASDRRVAAMAEGVVRHHADDDWFHGSEAFLTLSQRFTTRIAEVQSREPQPNASPRAWFVGHILVELLIDAELVGRRPELLDCYYGLVATLDPKWVADHVARMAGAQVGDLASFISKYVQLRFLGDYGDDERLTTRINQVLSRVGLEALPRSFTEVLAPCRQDVRERLDDLLAPPAEASVNEPAQTSSAFAA
jgi:hypothetical protein